jgi:MEMO1 family protein
LHPEISMPKPKLVACDTHPTQNNGQPAIYLKEKLGLTDQGVVVPHSLLPLLSLLDGERDAAAIRAALLLRYGITLSAANINQILHQLDEAYLLDSEHYRAAYGRALAGYRAGAFRSPVLAGKSYPADFDTLQTALDKYCQPYQDVKPAGRLRGVMCPHIDYERGHAAYAQIWLRAAEAAQEAELAIVFGTDHNGGPATVTITNQSYATPWGVLPTDRMLARALAVALGDEAAFGEELHHRGEHSIELALVWLHYIRQGQALPIVPILCGSFAPYLERGGQPEDDPARQQALEVLRQATSSRRTLVVVAGDLSHVGPVFGDRTPLGPIDRASLAAGDAQLLAALSGGDAGRFMGLLRASGDRQKVCGLPPAYWGLRALEPVRGESLAYTQCPADETGGSLVSIAGVLWE